MDTHGQRAYLGVALLGVPLVALCALGDVSRYAAVAAANLVVLVVLAVARRRGGVPAGPGGSLLVAGVAVLAAHNVETLAAVATSGSPADGAFAVASLGLGYALLLTGGLAVTFPSLHRDVGGVLDAMVIGLVVAVVMWGVVLGPAHERLGSGVVTRAYETFLVLLAAALTGAVVRAAVVARGARTAASLLVLAMCAADLSDIAYTLTLDRSTGLSAWWASAVAVVALVAFGAGLAHPAVAAVAAHGTGTRGLTRSRLVLLGGALAVNPAMAGVQAVAGHPVDVALLCVSSLLLVPLVLWRIGLLASWHADAARRLQDLASLDALTGLPNRRTMTAHLESTLDRLAAGTSPGAVVLYLDLDDFKAVNDTYGHVIGDRLLQAVATRVKACVRSCDVVARFGGDEFVVVLEGAPQDIEAVVLPGLERAMAEPVTIDAVVVSELASIGVAAISPGERVDAETVLRRADAEMYRVKRARRQARAQTAGV